ncbi:MAG: hypothetical protein NUW21_10150 [Elusimicrobia bacterium]|nr:hypothetical protein [Elusimicrobiota bacterium]
MDTTELRRKIEGLRPTEWVEYLKAGDLAEVLDALDALDACRSELGIDARRADAAEARAREAQSSGNSGELTPCPTWPLNADRTTALMGVLGRERQCEVDDIADAARMLVEERNDLMRALKEAEEKLGAAEKATAAERERCAVVAECIMDELDGEEQRIAAAIRRPPSIAATGDEEANLPHPGHSGLECTNPLACRECGANDVARGDAKERAALSMARACPDCGHTKCGESCVCNCDAARAEDALATARFVLAALRADLASARANLEFERSGEAQRATVEAGVALLDRAIRAEADRAESRAELAQVLAERDRLAAEAEHHGAALEIEVDAHAETLGREARLRTALDAAARSLRTTSRWGLLEGCQGDLAELRAWATSRERCARAALSEPSPGWVALKPGEAKEIREAWDAFDPLLNEAEEPSEWSNADLQRFYDCRAKVGAALAALSPVVPGVGGRVPSGACGCGSLKYKPGHLPQDHAGWEPK